MNEPSEDTTTDGKSLPEVAAEIGASVPKEDWDRMHDGTTKAERYGKAFKKIATVLDTEDDADGAIEKICRILKALGE